MLAQAVLGSVISLSVFLFFKEKPLIPPSFASSSKKDEFLPSLKFMFTKRNPLLIMLVYGIFTALFNSIATVIGQISTRFGYTIVNI